MSDFSHIGDKNQPKMVNVGDKTVTKRKATAKALMFLGEEIISHFTNDEIVTKKGPVFQTAIIAGIQAVKKTSDLIPMCHPLQINGVDIEINVMDKEHIEIFCTVEIDGKTGVGGFMHCIENKGVTLHVREDGPADGRVVMFSNSLGTDLRVWDALLPHLPSGLRLVRYDTRGQVLPERRV